MLARQKIRNSAGLEVCLFPMENLNCSQGAGFTSGGQIDKNSYTHAGAYAYDICGKDTGKDVAYAPVTVQIVQIDDSNPNYGNRVWFRSVDKVVFPDGVANYLHMYMIHCDNIDNLKNNFNGDNNPYPQGSVIYTEGVKGIGEGNHIHIEALRSSSTARPGFIPIPEYSGVPGKDGIYKMAGAEPIQKIFYLNDTTTINPVPQISGIGAFRTFSVIPFNPTGKNGWVQHNKGYYYYVVNGVMKTGWFEETKGVFYFLNDGKFAYLPKGAMLRSEWVAAGTLWYYIKESGIMANDEWLASGSNWFYLKVGGAMAVSEWVQTKEDGRCYFDASGYWVRNA